MRWILRPKEYKIPKRRQLYLLDLFSKYNCLFNIRYIYINKYLKFKQTCLIFKREDMYELIYLRYQEREVINDERIKKLVAAILTATMVIGRSA